MLSGAESTFYSLLALPYRLQVHRLQALTAHKNYTGQVLFEISQNVSYQRHYCKTFFLIKTNRGHIYWLSKQFDIKQYEKKKWKYNPDKNFKIKECPCLQWCASHQLYWFMTATYSTIRQKFNIVFLNTDFKVNVLSQCLQVYPLIIVQKIARN